MDKCGERAKVRERVADEKSEQGAGVLAPEKMKDR